MITFYLYDYNINKNVNDKLKFNIYNTNTHNK